MTGPSLNADGSLLSVQGLARSYVEPAPAFWRRARRRPVLADIDLAIHPGERVALIGASGAGKTTLLRTLLAIEEPDCGHILCQCQPVKPAGPAALRWYRRQVQYIPQDPAASLDPRMSVLAQVREPLHRLDVDCDCRSRAAEALASVGLGPEFHERRRAELSGGQAQRVAIARAIATRPALLVADEPVAAGGTDQGPDPYGLLMAALGACTSMTLHIYARHKGWALREVEVQLEFARAYAADCEGCEDPGAKIDRIRRRIVVRGALDAAQLARLGDIARKCPVHKTLTAGLRVDDEAVVAEE